MKNMVYREQIIATHVKNIYTLIATAGQRQVLMTHRVRYTRKLLQHYSLLYNHADEHVSSYWIDVMAWSTESL